MKVKRLRLLQRYKGNRQTVLFTDLDVMVVYLYTHRHTRPRDVMDLAIREIVGRFSDLGALKMASVHGPMTHANGCHINISPDIYFSAQTPPPNPSTSGNGCTRGTRGFSVEVFD